MTSQTHAKIIWCDTFRRRSPRTTDCIYSICESLIQSVEFHDLKQNCYWQLVLISTENEYTWMLTRNLVSSHPVRQPLHLLTPTKAKQKRQHLAGWHSLIEVYSTTKAINYTLTKALVKVAKLFEAMARSHVSHMCRRVFLCRVLLPWRNVTFAITFRTTHQSTYSDILNHPSQVVLNGSGRRVNIRCDIHWVFCS